MIFNAGLFFTPEVYTTSLQVYSMGTGFEGLRTVNFDIPPRSFTDILLMSYFLLATFSNLSGT